MILARFVRFVSAYSDDAVALIGFVCVAYGVALWSKPAAWIVSGCLLMAVAVTGQLRKGTHGPPR